MTFLLDRGIMILEQWEIRQRRKMKIDFKEIEKYLNHTDNCSRRTGHDCDCGLEELRMKMKTE